MSTAKFFIFKPFCKSAKHLREIWGTAYLLLHISTYALASLHTIIVHLYLPYTSQVLAKVTQVGVQKWSAVGVEFSLLEVEAQWYSHITGCIIHLRQ